MRARLHDLPALGLVVALAGVLALPSQLSMLSTLVVHDMWSFDGTGVLILQIVATGLQIAAGLAIAWRSRSAWLAVAGYAAMAVAVAVVGAVTVGRDDGMLVIAGLYLETVGPAVIVVAAPWWFTPHTSQPRIEASAVLLVLGATALIAQAFHAVDQVRMLATADRASAGVWIGFLLRTAIAVTIAGFALRASIRLRDGSVEVARRAMLVYVLVAVCSRAALTLIGIVALIVTGLRMPLTQLLASELISLASSCVIPLLLWAYVRRSLGAGELLVERHPPAAPAWAALLFVPVLLAKPLVLEATIAQLHGAALVTSLGLAFAAQGILNLLAGSAALRGRSTRSLAIAATVLAAGLATTLIVTSYLREPPTRHTPVWPLAVVVMTNAVLAWSHRRPDVIERAA